MKGGEKSRFIMQLDYELPKFNPNTKIIEQLLGPRSPGGNQGNTIIKDKTPLVMSRLMEKSTRGFSPSSLNLYINCPLQFYFQEIIGLSESETIEETIEMRTMGTAVHQVLQKVYEPYIGKYVDTENLKGKLAVTEEYLTEAFKQNYLEGDLEYGKNHLIYKVSLFFINEFIRQEAEKVRNTGNPASSLKIISLESLFETTLTFKVSGKPAEVRLKGKIDRIDQLDDTIRIIDYKTGFVEASKLKVKSWDTLIEDPSMAKAFQLLLYAWLYLKNNIVQDLAVQTGNITMRKISEGFIKVKLPADQEIGRESMVLFEKALQDLLENILDPKMPFVQTDDVENCTNCPFKSICTR